MAPEQKNSVDGLKSRLYSRQTAPVVHPEARTPLSPEHPAVPVGWEDSAHVARAASDTTEKKGHSLVSWFFGVSVGFFVLAMGVAAYTLFFGSSTVSPNNVDVEIVAPSLIDGGKQTTLQVLIHNRNASAIELADLVVDYPEGTRDPNDQTKALTHERQTVGTVVAGQQLKRTATAVFYGQEGAAQSIRVALEYRVPGSNAIFEKSAEAQFTIGSSPVSLSVDAPTEVISGQPFSISVVAQSNASEPVADAIVEVQYPAGFIPSATDPKIDTGSTLWRVGTLSPGDSKTIRITGTLEGQDGDERVFRFLAGADKDSTDAHIKVPFLTIPHIVSVHKPFISATISANSQSGKIITATPGEVVNGTINWQNNLTTSVSNAELTLTLTGPILDQKSITATNGFYQSANNSITWSKDQVAELAEVAPGESGTLSFSFSTKAPGTGTTLYKNPAVDLSLGVVGVRAGQGNVPEKVASVAATQVVFSSKLGLTASAAHASPAFTTVGPVPPKVGEKTSYALLFTVTNSSNTIANGVVSTTLPPYVTFMEAGDSSVVYDPPSRKVTWTLGDIKAGAGYTSASRQGQFQVSVFPSLSQVGTSPALTGAITLTGQDRFVQVPVSASATPPTTATATDNTDATQGAVTQ